MIDETMMENLAAVVVYAVQVGQSDTAYTYARLSAREALRYVGRKDEREERNIHLGPSKPFNPRPYWRHSPIDGPDLTGVPDAPA